MDGKVPETYAFLQQKCPESAEQQHSRGFQSLGKDGETCPCRNNTIINGPDSSANARNTYNIQQFYCVFHSGAFSLTTYLPTDREKTRDSGFCDPESLLYISQLAFPTSASPFQRRSLLSSGDHLLQQPLTVLSSFGVNVAGLLFTVRSASENGQ